MSKAVNTDTFFTKENGCSQAVSAENSPASPICDALAVIRAGRLLGRREALRLRFVPLELLCKAADGLRLQFCGSAFDMCAIVNGKCGRCSEDCRYCAQSAHYPSACGESYPLLSSGALLAQAERCAAQGIPRFSIVTSGKRLSGAEVELACESIRLIREKTGLSVCASFGLLGRREFTMLRQAGVSRIHCNLESSRRFFPSVCTTHTWQEKADTLKAARQAGLSICSGGIIGLGETMEDRIDMVLAARELGAKSIPLNLLNPIPGTPFGHNPVLSPEELRRTAAIFRFLIPDGFIRLAGGRGLMPDRGEACFKSGANAAISGDMLTTSGCSFSADLKLIKNLGYEVKCCDEI